MGMFVWCSVLCVSERDSVIEVREKNMNKVISFVEPGQLTPPKIKGHNKGPSRLTKQTTPPLYLLPLDLLSTINQLQ
jgi:hypothetical protein